MGRFATGVSIVTTIGADAAPAGMTANAVSSLSLDPPLVLVCADRGSRTLAAIKIAGVFAVNVLHEDQEELARRFATRGPKTFTGLDTVSGASGAPLLADCLAILDCRLEAMHDGGDHQILIGRVESAVVITDRPPLLFFQSSYVKFSQPE